MKFSRETIESVDIFFRYSSTRHQFLQHWPKSREVPLRDLVRELEENVLRDFLGNAVVEGIVKGQLPRSLITQDMPASYPSFRRNPVSCGMLMLRYRILMQHFSTEVLVTWRPVIRVLHLYNAARNEFPSLVPPCPDFEAFISIHTPEKIFIGARPTNAKEYFTRYLLQEGHSAQNFASDARFLAGGGIAASSRKARLYTVEPSISAIYWDRCCANADGRPRFTLETLENVFKASESAAGSETVENSETSPGLDELSSQDSTHKKRRRRQSSLASQMAKFHKLTPVQLLTALQDGIAEQDLALKYDYLSLHIRCNEILWKIMSSIDRDVLDQKGIAYGEDRLPNLGLVIFLQNSSLQMDMDAAGESLQALRSGNKISKNDDMMQSVAETMRISVLEEGRKEIDTVTRRRDENIRVPLHLWDGSMLKNRMKADQYSSLQRGVRGSVAVDDLMSQLVHMSLENGTKAAQVVVDA